MEYPKYKIELEMTGLTQKQAAEVIAEIYSTETKYENEEYSVSDLLGRKWIVGKAGGIECQKRSGDKVVGANFHYDVKIMTPFLDGVDIKKLKDIMNELENRGGLVNDSTKLNVMVASRELNDDKHQNLLNIFSSKGDLIFKAIGSPNSNEPEMMEFDGKKSASFPMYRSSVDFERLHTSLLFASSLLNMAVAQKFVNPKKTEIENEKFTMRTFLIRLGMIGDEYKTARSMLIENLIGNPSWKNEEDAEKHREKLKEKRLSEKALLNMEKTSESQIVEIDEATAEQQPEAQNSQSEEYGEEQTNDFEENQIDDIEEESLDDTEEEHTNGFGINMM